MADSLAGKLLVATPSLVDPNFARTVVLLCEHNDEGALGVVLNRPLEHAAVSEHLPEWLPYVSGLRVIFQGGPVEPSTALALGELAGTARPEGWSPVLGRTGLLSLSREPGDFGGDLRRMRVFSGYSGWTGGQLEGEVKQEAWFVVAAAPEDLFTPEPETLWRRVLQRQDSKLALFAYFPTDPRAN